MPGTYGKYPAVASGGGSGFVPQKVVGTPQTTLGGTTSSTFATITNSPAVSITAVATGTYKVFGSLVCGGDSVTTIQCKITATSGSPTIQADQVSRWFVPAANYTNNMTPYLIVTLTAGQSYTFSTQMATGAGNAYARNDLATNGNYLVVYQIA